MSELERVLRKSLAGHELTPEESAWLMGEALSDPDTYRSVYEQLALQYGMRGTPTYGGEPGIF